jgi:hypothetical protein
MSKWKRLDLTRIDLKPRPDELTAIRIVPKIGYVFGPAERHEIGYLRPDPRSSSPKLWWQTDSGNVVDPARMRKKNDIWWCPVAPFDGF